MHRVRVLIVDDSAPFLDSAVELLSRDPRVRVVGVAVDGHEGVRLCDTLSPDLVLMDLTMPGMDGVEATRLIKARPEPPKVVIVTLDDRPESHARAREAGADGLIGKAEFADLAPAAVEAVYAVRAGLAEGR